ncbi:CDP-glycerol glycerophosphotransferase family protein [Listeria fleischmannii]|uniref:CDP-glycerol glycerophosphotransferase family protein n=1 Tax=Listeria fleischmannii TaxID=1069827 RepID=UPI0004ACB18C
MQQGHLKKFGFSALFASDSETEEFEKRAHSSYTDVLVSSENLISEYSEAFRVAPSKVKPIGVPRTDLLF